MAPNLNPRVTSGITKDSTKYFLVDAGCVYLNFGEDDERPLGATRGGASFSIEQDIRTVEVDGLKGPTKGARRVVESIARINANLLELTKENLMLALAGTTVTETNILGEEAATDPTHNSFRRTREMGDMDYLKNIALVGKLAGTTQNFIGILYNALADGGFELETNDRDEVVLEIQFTAHYDFTDLVTDPWEIRLPIIEDVVGP